MVEEAEAFLRDQGFYDLRVRHHELGGALKAHLARIEVGPNEFQRWQDAALRESVLGRLRGLGYGLVTVDLNAYRRGPSSIAFKPPTH